jgi:hypothetical protein
MGRKVVGRFAGSGCPSFEGQPGGEDEAVVAGAADDLDRGR